ncbi:MAG TPA: class I SAM-dependent methyltransferase [Thermoanaerobaculia bacterium]|nr:class I SAM-dependent methyltransferase [Thermoanaerobaculia bacterium]
MDKPIVGRDTDLDLGPWIERLFEEPALLSMGHNQRIEDASLGLGWVYYALCRLVRPRNAVVIGSYRGFVPLVVGRAFQDNLEEGRVTFVDPSMVDGFWTDPASVRAHFERFGVSNVRHFRMTTQEFVGTEEYAGLGEIGLLFVDGYHTAEQARFDWEAFEAHLGPWGLALFHDSLVLRESAIYGADRVYRMTVKELMDELRLDPALQVLDLPFGTGLTLVRKAGGAPLLEGRQERPRPPTG